MHDGWRELLRFNLQFPSIAFSFFKGSGEKVMYLMIVKSFAKLLPNQSQSLVQFPTHTESRAFGDNEPHLVIMNRIGVMWE